MAMLWLPPAGMLTQSPPSAVRLLVNVGVTVTAEAGMVNVAVLLYHVPPVTVMSFEFSSTTLMPVSM